MVAEKTIRFRAGDVELDGRIATPNGASRACVVCHPHPLYGGDMNSSVVVAIAQALGAAGVATLRFDFRGVGRSTGAHGGGVAEVGDARAALDMLAAATGADEVMLAGYSFGSLVALRVASGASDPRQATVAGPAASAGAVRPAAMPRVAAVAAVAPPLAMFDTDFITRLPMPSLLLAGDRDVYCPRSDFEALAARLPGCATTALLPAADHFFAGREHEVADIVVRWVGNCAAADAR